MHGAGKFLLDYGWMNFLLAAVFILAVDFVLEKFIEAERTRKIILFLIALLIAALEFYFGIFDMLK